MKLATPTKALLCSGMSLDAIATAVLAKKPATFRWLEMVEGKAESVGHNTIIATTVIPVRFGVNFENTKMRRIENRIFDARDNNDVHEIMESFKTTLPEVLETMSMPAKSLLTAKTTVLIANPTATFSPSLRATVTESHLDARYPFISYARNGTIQLTAIPSFPIDLQSGCVRQRFSRWYLLPDDTEEVLELLPRTDKERHALEELTQTIRARVGKTPRAGASQMFRPAINHIVAIY